LKIIFDYLEKMGLKKEIKFEPSLTRGLDYYTNMIFEIYAENYQGGSLAGGGRYNNLIKTANGVFLPSVGFSFGIDRLMEEMEQQNLFKDRRPSLTKVLVTIFSPDYLEKSNQVATLLRSDNKVNAELYLEPKTKLDKQIKYADKKGIRYVVIIGPDEDKNKTVTIKDLSTGRQSTIALDKINQFFGF